MKDSIDRPHPKLVGDRRDGALMSPGGLERNKDRLIASLDNTAYVVGYNDAMNDRLFYPDTEWEQQASYEMGWKDGMGDKENEG